MPASVATQTDASTPSSSSRRGGPTSAKLWGHDRPRIDVAPSSGLTRGDDVVALAEALGEPLLPWQSYAIRRASAVDHDGQWLARNVSVVVARQNGKTHLLRMRILTGLFVWGERLIVHAAQNREIALETFRAVEATIRSTPWLREELDYVRRTNGQEEIALKNGSRYRIVAATPGGARGLSADVVLLDEAREHRTHEAYAALAYTTQARPNAQIWLTSNAGDATSVVLNAARASALELLDVEQVRGLCYLEWSAPPGVAIDDVDGIAQANPALGHTITLDAILARLASDPADVFRTEALCQWVDTLDSPWPPGAWARAEVDGVELDTTGERPTWLAVDVSLDRRSAGLIVVQKVEGLPVDGVLPGMEPDRFLAVLVDEWHAEGAVDDLLIAGDVAERFREFHAREVDYDRYTAAAIANRLASAGIPVHDVSGADFAGASDGLLSAMCSDPPRVIHTGQPALADHLNACARKPAADGGWRIVRRSSAGPVQGAIALAMALHRAQQPAVEPRIIVG